MATLAASRLPLLRTTSVAAVGLGAWLAPAVAAACPYCASTQHGGPGTSIALGVFLLLPFVVAGVVYAVLRAHGHEAEEAASGPGAE